MTSRTALDAAVRAAALGSLLLAIAAAPARAQAAESAGPSLYLTVGGAKLQPVGGFSRTGATGGGVFIAGLLPLEFDMLPAWAQRSLGVRLEFSDYTYGSAPYTESVDPRMTGEELSAGVRTHVIGLQVTRPGRVLLRPYAAASVGQTKFTLDGEREGKLSRRDGAGAVLRAGTYLALWRSRSPAVLDLSAGYHANGQRAHWREGEASLTRGSANFFDLTVAIGFAAAR